MSKRWGQAQYGAGADRWTAHPMYLLGAQVFREMEAREHPAVAPERSKLSRQKATARRGATPSVEPGPTLTLDGAKPAAEPELPPEAEASRAAGRAWRA